MTAVIYILAALFLAVYIALHWISGRQKKPASDRIKPVRISVKASRPRRTVKPYSTLERNAQQNKARRESIDRRYRNNGYPW